MAIHHRTKQESDRALNMANVSVALGGREILSDLSLTVTKGSAFGLLGPNGAGKTTTIRLAAGLLTPSSGSIRLFGEEVVSSSSDHLRQRMGIQTDGNLYDLLTVEDNLAAWGDLFGMGKRDRNRRVTEVLELFALNDRRADVLGSFSKGMKQKVAIARSILHEPELLILDEPTAGLDPSASSELIGYLAELIRSQNTTVVICTHQLQGLELLCDSIGILKGGSLAAAGPVDDLISTRWPDRVTRFDIAGDSRDARDALGDNRHVLEIAHDDTGVTVRTQDEGSVPALVAALVEQGTRIEAVIPRKRTIEELYFATIDKEA